MTEPKLRTAGRTHRTDLTVDVFTAARQRMKLVYEKFETVVISWSGGKDSSSCLEIARETAREMGRLPIKVFFLDEEVIYPETLDLCYRHMSDPEIEFYWVCVPSIYRNACSEKEPDFIPFDPTKRALWTHVPPKEAIWPAGVEEDGTPKMSDWRIPPSIVKRAMYIIYGQEGKVFASITGLRTQESFVRLCGMMSSGNFITKAEHGMVGVRLIYDWRASDVWLAIKENGWDYNKAYEKLWRAGGSPISTRVAPLFHAEAAEHLRNVMLFWPKFWPLVRRRVRGAQAVAIHGGALHAVERWQNETWQNVAVRYLNGLGSKEDRDQMHAWVQRVLDDHNHHSGSPMQEEQDCARCGISWKRIARACARGDRQERMLKTYGNGVK